MDWAAVNPLFTAILSTAVIAGTPLLYAALGEILTERAGVLNLGVEGMMLVGAVSGFIVTILTNNHWWGVLAAMLAAGALAAVHAFLSVTLRANQVVSGLALTIFGTGLSGYLGKDFVGNPVPQSFKAVPVPYLSDIPLLGKILFTHDLLIYLSFILVGVLWFFLYYTKGGLNLRAVGENPGAADVVGIKVYRTRYFYVILGGMLAGVGGAYLSLAYAPTWLENMTAGRGWIAVALVIFATWDPFKALLGAYIFGGVDALSYRFQALGFTFSPYLLKMLPYVLTILVLIIVTRETGRRRFRAPGTLGQSYDREER